VLVLRTTCQKVQTQVLQALEQTVGIFDHAARLANLTGIYTSTSCELPKSQTLSRISDTRAFRAKYEKTGLNFNFTQSGSQVGLIPDTELLWLGLWYGEKRNDESACFLRTCRKDCEAAMLQDQFR
jgi:hypothetical protein